jgi:hypothetical protein
MPRSTTSAGTRRPLLGLLTVELIVAVTLVARPAGPPPGPAAVTMPTTSTAASSTATLSDGRTVELVSLGGQETRPLLDRVESQMDDAARAVTAFWGIDWPREVVIVATASDEQFRALARGGPGIAATTTGQRIIFAPGAAMMTGDALRIVLRHELFHYAARAQTAPDAPRWLTEGVADFVARPQTPRPGTGQAAQSALGPRASWGLPTDTDLDTVGTTRALAYDRAWWFTRFVSDRYGQAALRRLYERACGPGHSDVGRAVSMTLGADLDEVLAGWRQWMTR